MLVKFEFRIFKVSFLTLFGAISIQRPKFRRSRDPGHAAFRKILRGYVRTVSGNTHVKFEVRSFNRFKLIWLTGPLRTDTLTDTLTERRKQYLRHSLRSLGGDSGGLLQLPPSYLVNANHSDSFGLSIFSTAAVASWLASVVVQAKHIGLQLAGRCFESRPRIISFFCNTVINL